MGNLAQQPKQQPVLADMDHLLQRFQQVRATSEAICAPLQIEDYVIQSMPDVSPPKWHLAHQLVFRGISAQALSARLQATERGLRPPVQFLL